MNMLSQYASNRDNNFNLIRLLAAFAVVVSHSRAIVFGDTALELLEVETGYTLGHLAVNVFFVISGFLITQSFVRSQDAVSYITARLLRLVPGLVVAALVTVFIIGPWATTASMSDYFGDITTWSYVPLVGSLVAENSIPLMGVFTALPFADELNVPLWTLRWGFLAYLAIAALGMIGLLGSAMRFTPIFLLFIIVYVCVTLLTDLRTSIDAVDHAMRLGLCFILGSAFFMYRSYIVISILPAAAVWFLVYLVKDSALYQGALILALGYSTFWLAYIPEGAIRLYNKFGDISYGVYIYGFLLGQVTIFVLPHLNASELLVYSTLPILIAATLSYYLVEAPMMKRRKKVTNWLKSLIGFVPNSARKMDISQSRPAGKVKNLNL